MSNSIFKGVILEERRDKMGNYTRPNIQRRGLGILSAIPNAIESIEELAESSGTYTLLHEADHESWDQTGNTSVWSITVPASDHLQTSPTVSVQEDGGSTYGDPSTAPTVTINTTTEDVTVTAVGPTYATSTLTFTGQPSNNDTLTISGGGTTYPVYTFKSTLIAGTTSAIMVHIGTTLAQTIQNLTDAINNASGNTTGFSRHADLQFPDPVIRATNTATTCVVRAHEDLWGGMGNRITFVESINNCTASSATLATGAPDHASTVWTITGAVAEDETFTINTDVYTVKDAPSAPFEVLSGDETDFAANFTAAINGTDGINDPSEFVVAFNQTAATVLLNAKVPGTAANDWDTIDDSSNASPTGATMADTGAAATDTRYAGRIIIK